MAANASVSQWASPSTTSRSDGSDTPYSTPLTSPAQSPASSFNGSGISGVVAASSSSEPSLNGHGSIVELELIWSNAGDGVSVTTIGKDGYRRTEHIGLPIRSKNYSSSTPEVPESIDDRRNTFFIAKRDTVLPLLPEKNFLERFVEKESYDNVNIRPYELLESQPVG